MHTKLLLFSILFFFFPSPFQSQRQSNSLLLLPLTNTLSISNSSSIPHLLTASSHRSAARHRHLHRHGPGRHRRRQLSLPLSPGSDYTLSLSVGPPASPTAISLFLDTGSDLVWFPCSPFSCILCEGKPNATRHSAIPKPPSDSRPVSCSSPFCSAAHSALPPSDLCAAASCPLEDIETSSCVSQACPKLYYAYGDGSLVAHLRHGRLALAASLAVPNFTFACAHAALAEPVGVAGFGRGPLSLPAQLAALSPALSGRFSYCLVDHSFRPDRLVRPSPLILGRSSEPDLLDPSGPGFIYTPLLHNPKHPYFYSVALEAISVGSNRIPARSDLGYVDRSGNGGMVVDSGTTFTMLPNETYSLVAAEFDRVMTSTNQFDRAEQTEAKTGLKPCYYHSGSDRAANRAVPGLVFHFKGNATVVLPRRNYFTGFKSDGKQVGCLMLMNGGDVSGDDEGGPAGTLGNFQQQGFEVVYDLEEGRVGFARRRCSALWDSLSRG